MKKIISMVAMSVLFGPGAMASPKIQKIGMMNQVESTIQVTPTAITCLSRSSNDHNGQPIATVLINQQSHLGFLAATTISEDIVDPNGTICTRLQEILDRSPVNFGFVRAVVDSTLFLIEGELVEYIDVTISNLPLGNEEMESVTVKQRRSMPTIQN